MTTKQTPSPLPLFDTLENLTLEGNSLPPEINQKDYRYVADFLYSYRGSAATFNTYRRELERFLQWGAWVAKKSLGEIKRGDIEAYVEFCQAPPLEWIGVKKVDRFINQGGERVGNPEWRPFVVKVPKSAHREGVLPDVKAYALSQNALQAIFAVCSSFYNFLIAEDYLDANPVAQIRQKSKFLRKQQTKTIIRRLSELQWGYVIETAEKMAGEDPEVHERTLFMMNALFAMYLRISELASSPRWTPQMGDFFIDQDGNWWFTTVGKGNKERQIAVSNAMLTALKRYRQSRALTPLPSPGESTPLIPKNRGRGPIESTRHIRLIVQICFDAAYERMVKDGFKEDAQQLTTATVHWLRHTGISEDVKIRPREHVRDDAGHGSSAITDRYIDVEMRERHASGRRKQIKPDHVD